MTLRLCARRWPTWWTRAHRFSSSRRTLWSIGLWVVDFEPFRQPASRWA